MTLAGASQLTLSEFLLARIAEDERAAERAAIWHTKNGFAWIGPTPAEATVLAISGHRLLAECEAKRRIVELADQAIGLEVTVESDRATTSPTDQDPPYVGDQILMALALPYADHPDYREEWRP